MSKALCSVIWSIEKKDVVSPVRNMPSQIYIKHLVVNGFVS